MVLAAGVVAVSGIAALIHDCDLLEVLSQKLEIASHEFL